MRNDIRISTSRLFNRYVSNGKASSEHLHCIGSKCKEYFDTWNLLRKTQDYLKILGHKENN